MNWLPIDYEENEIPTGEGVLVCGDGEGNVFMAWFDGVRWFSWEPFEDDRPLPFKPTHWLPAPDSAEPVDWTEETP